MAAVKSNLPKVATSAPRAFTALHVAVPLAILSVLDTPFSLTLARWAGDEMEKAAQAAISEYCCQQETQVIHRIAPANRAKINNMTLVKNKKKGNLIAAIISFSAATFITIASTVTNQSGAAWIAVGLLYIVAFLAFRKSKSD